MRSRGVQPRRRRRLPRPSVRSTTRSGTSISATCTSTHSIRSTRHMWDTRTTPAEAYRFARGESLNLPPLDAEGHGTRTVHLDRPLDFTAVTDHSEFLGEVETCTTPGSPTYDSTTCQDFRAGTARAYANLGVRLTASKPLRVSDVCGPDGRVCSDAAGTVWDRMQEAAAAAYDRCTFTSFVAYEYSRSPGGSTMHRNVIFRNDHVAFPVSAFEQPSPQGLWRELQAGCTRAGTGCDVLAIPHNTNESNGHTFFVEYPGATTVDDERQQARTRALPSSRSSKSTSTRATRSALTACRASLGQPTNCVTSNSSDGRRCRTVATAEDNGAPPARAVSPGWISCVARFWRGSENRRGWV